MTGKRDHAKRFAQHYFSLLANAANLHWDTDNRAEIGDLIDFIIDAAKEELIAEFNTEVAKLATTLGRRTT